MGPQIQWLHSYVTEDKVYFVYLAPDEDVILEHARRARIPANRVAAVAPLGTSDWSAMHVSAEFTPRIPSSRTR